MWVDHSSREQSGLSCFGCSEGNLATVQLTNVTFTENIAQLSGGAIFSVGVTVATYDSVLDQNSAGMAGGAACSH